MRRASRQASGGALCTEPVAEAVRRERLAEFGHQIGKVTRRRRIGIVKATWLDAGQGGRWRWRMKNLFRYFNSSPEVIGRTVMLYIRYPLSLRQVEDILFERSIDIRHETVRLWWNRFGPMYAAEIRKRRIHHRCYSPWRWHADEVFARINGRMFYL